MRISPVLLSMLVIFGAIPFGFASESNGNVAIIVSTPADAIVAAPYAKAMGYKIVYTPTDALSDEAKRELVDNHITKVIIVGGPVAVSNNVENELKVNLNLKTERVWGETRVETAQKVFEALKKENPEAVKNVVIVEGFNEKISPIAVSFNAPVLYYAPGREKAVIDALKTVKVDNAIILGNSIPKDIKNVASSVAKTTIVAQGKNDEVIKTALSYVPKLNPDVSKKDVAVVYAEKSKDPIMTAILNFANGYVSAVIPIPSSDRNTINAIVSKVTFAPGISVASDSSAVLGDLKDITNKLGTSVSVIETPSLGGGGGGHHGGENTPTTPTQNPEQKYTVISINNNGEKVIRFADIGSSKEDGNYVEVIGDENIKLPEITIKTNAVNKAYSVNGNTVSITFNGNANALNLVYPIEYGAVTYGDNVTVKFYGSKALANKEVTLHLITSRQDLRNAVNELLSGDASKLIDLLNNNPVKITKTTDSNGDATFTVSPQNYGENIIVITEGNGNIGNKVTILGIGGFENLKYKLNITKDSYFQGTATFNLTLNQTPSNPVRYGLLLVTKDGYKGTISVIGTTPNDKNFNVSVVGDKGSENVVENSRFITLNASKVQNIINTIFNSNTAGAWYSDITTHNKEQAYITSDIPQGTECYVIGIVYEPASKKIVAMKQIPITLE